MHRSDRRFTRALLVAVPTLALLLAAFSPAFPAPHVTQPGLGFLARLAAAARNTYAVVPLVSDGSVPAPHVDPALVNPWGLAHAPAGPWWVVDNGTDLTTLYDGDGVANPLVVSLPAGAAPTGMVFSGLESFPVSDGVVTEPSVFLFAGEDGRVFGWNPIAPLPVPSHNAFVVYDNSASDAIYKGITIARPNGEDRLYLTDFHNRRIEVLDGSFQPVSLPANAFVDPFIPGDFGPFGIQNIQDRIVVTYAKRDADGEDDVAGRGLGFVDAFDADGRLLTRIGIRGPLNAPWGIALAPQAFGRFGGDLLVGNFGDGRITAYTLVGGFRFAFPHGQLTDKRGRPITIEGLWGLGFGNNLGSGSSDTLFFTAGPDDEQHGLFGKIEVH